MVEWGWLREHCRSGLSHYKVPKQFVALGALPATATGKVQKHLLKARVEEEESMEEEEGGQAMHPSPGVAGVRNGGAPAIRSRL